jgi:beta-galactosidase
MSHVLTYDKFTSNLPNRVMLRKDNEHLFMEYLNLNYHLASSNHGFILYRLDVNLKADSMVVIKTDYIRDYAMLVCDCEKVLVTINHQQKLEKIISIELQSDCNQLDVFVENMGRLSDLKDKSEFSSQRKGLLSKDAIGFIRANKDVLGVDTINWRIYFIDFLPNFFNRFAFNSDYVEYKWDYVNVAKLPIIMYGKFTAFKLKDNQDTGGVYLLLSNFNKGVLFINGHNMGKYWNRGPLLTLFVPSSFINNGSNEINLFDLHGLSNEPIIFVTKMHVLF